MPPYEDHPYREYIIRIVQNDTQWDATVLPTELGQPLPGRMDERVSGPTPERALEAGKHVVDGLMVD